MEMNGEGKVLPVSYLDGFNRSGVYFLYRDGVVVYVGQAVDVRRRIGVHIGEGVKVFDSVSFVPCAQSGLLALEKQYIERLQPEYNKAGNPAAFTGEGFGSDTPIPFTKAHYNLDEAADYLGLEKPEVISLTQQGVLFTKRVSKSRDRRYRAIDLHEYRSKRSA